MAVYVGNEGNPTTVGMDPASLLQILMDAYKSQQGASAGPGGGGINPFALKGVVGSSTAPTTASGTAVTAGSPALGVGGTSTGTMLGLKTGDLVLGGASIASGLLNSYLQNKQFNAQQALSEQQAAVMRALGLADRVGTTAGLGPAAERQKLSLLHTMLSNARPAQVDIPGAFKPFAGNVKAPFRLPEGGFTPEQLAFISPESLKNQEAAYQNTLKGVDERYAPPSNVGYEKQGKPPGTPEDMQSGDGALKDADILNQILLGKKTKQVMF